MSLSHSRRNQFVRLSSELLDAMANAQRLAILSILIGEEISVGSLSKRIGLSQSALSQHLSRLRSAGLVVTRRDAQTIYYRCEDSGVKQLVATLSELFPSKTPPASFGV
ncbi:ArsR family transcriptional regulator [Neorhizobium lilium]|uniref:ArsR family transcriptional regulator n=1 Tax=Neorhizobium lilium TaxID=2503024 RepID=A0A444LAN1_9HYPH|nr:metalloregulator ArsR/SmtB family transcription factor [Neorhizobium lilium]RWX74684.1 ArsR family transcriptional regulator [Neorhizobium lilium]